MKEYNELINYTNEDWKEYFLKNNFFRELIQDATYEEIESLKKQELIYASKRDKSKELLEELRLKMCRYDSHNYTIFINNNIDNIEKLTYDDKFHLLKETYTGAKDCTEIGFLIDEHAKDYGVPVSEKINIKKAFNGRDKVIAYRGINKYNLKKNGGSYTLDKDTAVWFANRYGNDGYVVEKEITVDDVIFYYGGRKEQEVFLFR